MNRERNCLKDVCLCLICVLLALLGLSFVPEWKCLDYKLRKVDILADIQKTSVEDSVSMLGGDSLMLAHVPDSLKMLKKNPITNDTVSAARVVPIEDFSESAKGLVNLRTSLEKYGQTGRPVRIAFLGDSYIEADIITSDIREFLQQEYGGRGVGFVPIMAQAAEYRKTIEHHFEKWTPYSMVYHQKANWKKLLISGQYFIPSEGARVSYKGTNRCKRTSSFGTARFFFINEKSTHVHVKINGTKDTLIAPPSADTLQQIYLQGEIHSLEFSFSNVSGFTGFGLYLNDSTGVFVDNFSLRGSSGIVLSIMDKDLVEELLHYVSYDLIVLQYGLNVATPNAKAYSAYKRQMVKVVEHLKDCFPQSDFMIMSVPDRSIREGNKFVTMPGILPMIDAQRDIARETGIAFWNTFEAMGGRNSMLSYVNSAPPLANKDYTHINHAGGKRIASELIRAFMKEFSTKTNPSE